MSFFPSALGLLVGACFILVSVIPDALEISPVPVPLRVFIFAIGTALLVFAAGALRHAIRAREVLATDTPQRVVASVTVDSGCDTTTYTVHTTIDGEAWAVPAYYGKGVARLEDGSAGEVLAWCDPVSGAPVAFSVDGHMVRTYPRPLKRLSGAAQG
ncbi:hypothetical protein XM53_08385 [Roseovarius atlanticus]|uniref:Uncharacterized protein n=1 Tax=Roseovarius atlanticus TaxID=1641875 RepID=A0A0T5NW40_9RHOB|nr:hypothetical protein [Roseovarius atlanticus]KRS13154.1 hypothetical protein XM53_08385 [Roseovarius atlanticus]